MSPELLARLRPLLPVLDAMTEHGTSAYASLDGPWPRGTGVRPELLSVNQEGVHNYSLTAKQAARLAERIRSELALTEGEPCP